MLGIYEELDLYEGNLWNGGVGMARISYVDD
jgi:hypothetical protein